MHFISRLVLLRKFDLFQEIQFSLENPIATDPTKTYFIEFSHVVFKTKVKLPVNTVLFFCIDALPGTQVDVDQKTIWLPIFCTFVVGADQQISVGSQGKRQLRHLSQLHNFTAYFYRASDDWTSEPVELEAVLDFCQADNHGIESRST